MIRQATVRDISQRRVTRRHGTVLVVTRYYPRFLKRNLIDEYLPSLAPPKELLEEFKREERRLGGHDQAFENIRYEEKFVLQPGGLEDLSRIAAAATGHDVYLVCHCDIGSRCHREILMLIAEVRFGAKIGKLHFTWTTIRSRIAKITGETMGIARAEPNQGTVRGRAARK